MSADTLLSRLDKVKSTGRGKWVACCPAHGDRSPSLSIREIDGRALLHCFAGCSALEVLDALGLHWADLYPPREPGTNRVSRVPPPPYRDALICIAGEAWVALIAAGNLERRMVLTDADLQRLTLAVHRITDAGRATGIWK